jgi:hypothetical protein
MWKCKYCLKDFNFNCSQIQNHSRWCIENPKRKEEKQFQIKICPTCKNEFLGKNKFCSKKCITHSAETKAILSIKRKNFLKQNPEAHSWKNSDKHNSVPCENVKKFLLDNNYNFIEEFTPLKERFFSIDIAFPDQKIGLEINGNQHYNSDGTLKPYYQERHDLIESAGWRLIEIHYSQCFKNDFLIDIITNNKDVDYSNYFDERERRKREKQDIFDIKTKLKQEQINVINEKIEEIKNNLLNSSINFQKWGWVYSASLIIGCLPQKVNKWMIRNMKEFYELECFKRKS